jgi:hypothetical protein
MEPYRFITRMAQRRFWPTLAAVLLVQVLALLLLLAQSGAPLLVYQGF